MKDAVTQKTAHIFFSNEGYFVEGVDYQYLVLKTGFNLVKEINYFDLEFNQNLANQFFDSIMGLEKWWEENNNNKGFVQIPLLRIFSLWLSRYLMNNLVINESSLNLNDVSSIPQAKESLRKILI